MIPALQALKIQNDAEITTVTAINSIPPDVVGGITDDLIDIIDPLLEFELNRVYSGSDVAPSPIDGQDGYVVFQGGNSNIVTVWQKISGDWINNGTFSIVNYIYFTNNGTSGISCNLSTGVVTVSMASFPTIASNGIIRANIDILIGGFWHASDVLPEITKDGSGILLTASFTLGNTGITTIRGRIY